MLAAVRSVIGCRSRLLIERQDCAGAVAFVVPLNPPLVHYRGETRGRRSCIAIHWLTWRATRCVGCQI